MYNTKRHKHADLIHAWAEGAEIQVYTNMSWRDTIIPTWSNECHYRIKPKEKVKRWRWVFALPNKNLAITEGYYSNSDDFSRYNQNCNLVECIKSTEIEVEE